MRVVAISGSIRSDSTNASLLRAAARLAPDGWHFDFYDRQIGELPHFRPDLDEEGMDAPPAVADFRRLLRGSDAVMISSPEYAHGVPGSFKNAMDWLVSSSELTGKPTALLMASPSGAPHAHAAMVPNLLVMGAKLVFDESLLFSRRHLDAGGRIADPVIEAQVRRALDALQRASSSPAGTAK